MWRLRSVILAAAAVLAGAPADPACAGKPDSSARCETHARVADRVMRHRQETNDLESTWRMAGLIRDPELSRVAQRLVPEAYRRPRQAAAEDRERTAGEFAAEARAACQASTT